METRIQNVDVYYDDVELALRRGGQEGQDSNFSDVHRTWIRWFKRRQAVHRFEIQPLGHSKYL